MNTFDGECHCGAIQVRFTTARAPEDLDVRQCRCSFCRKHGSRNVTDPDGRVELGAGEPSLASRYEFASKTAEFMTCRRCGVYVGAVLFDDASAFATININSLDDSHRFSADPRPVTYDDEPQLARASRRVSGWTPAVLRWETPIWTRER